jgi:hypothetical protein
MTDEAQYDLKLLEFRLTLLKDEITAQANAFDQIDSKTGVALGFMFVAVAQVLAALFLVPTERSHFAIQHSCLTNCTFFFANLSALCATAFGAVSRWPRGFEHSLDLKIDAEDSYQDTLRNTVKEYKEITEHNQSVNSEKNVWAKPTYLCTGLSLILYVVFTLLLYFY